MAWGYGGGFPAYESVAERKAKAERKIAELKKKGRTLSPVSITGNQIATTFWGRSWCEHLERYSDYATRLPRGRSYAKNGLVIDLQIETGKLRALVSGSELYEVEARIVPAPKPKWRALVSECAGKIDSVVELLSGQLSDGVMEVLCRKDAGLFPSPNEIELECSCPDGAYLCKHLAAVLYGVGARLDHSPELLFTLRGVDQMDLVSEAGKSSAKVGTKKSRNVLKTDTSADLAGIFGIDLEGASEPVAAAGSQRTRAKRPATKKTKTMKTTKRSARK